MYILKFTFKHVIFVSKTKTTLLLPNLINECKILIIFKHNHKEQCNNFLGTIQYRY